MYVLMLIIGVIIGAAGVELVRTTYTGSLLSIGHWQMGVYSGRDTTAAWRLNAQTGHLEACSAVGDTPHCSVMPPPQGD
jgi:hypothetical protein